MFRTPPFERQYQGVGERLREIDAVTLERLNLLRDRQFIGDSLPDLLELAFPIDPEVALDLNRVSAIPVSVLEEYQIYERDIYVTPVSGLDPYRVYCTTPVGGDLNIVAVYGRADVTGLHKGFCIVRTVSSNDACEVELTLGGVGLPRDIGVRWFGERLVSSQMEDFFLLTREGDRVEQPLVRPGLIQYKLDAKPGTIRATCKLPTDEAFSKGLSVFRDFEINLPEDLLEAIKLEK